MAFNKIIRLIDIEVERKLSFIFCGIIHYIAWCVRPRGPRLDVWLQPFCLVSYDVLCLYIVGVGVSHVYTTAVRVRYRSPLGHSTSFFICMGHLSI